MDGKKLKVYGQTIFINVTKSKEGDSYFRYRGYLLSDILRIAGMKKNATSVDVISIDGFTHTFDVALLKKTFKQAAPVFGLDKETLGDCGWVRYAPGLRKGAKLPAANALLTFEMNGVEYDPGNLDPKTGKLTGSGPFRIVAPQMINPGPPDLSRMADAACVDKTPVKFRFNDKYEKNSDYCVKTVVAIRVNPMPKGKSDFDWKRKADELIAGKKIVVFGDVGK
jgi:hypothetical protein